MTEIMEGGGGVMQECLLCHQEYPYLAGHLSEAHGNDCFLCMICYPSPLKLYCFHAKIMQHLCRSHAVASPSIGNHISLPRTFVQVTCTHCISPKIFIGKSVGEASKGFFEHMEKTHVDIDPDDEERVQEGVRFACRLCGANMDLLMLKNHVTGHYRYSDSEGGTNQNVVHITGEDPRKKITGSGSAEKKSDLASDPALNQRLSLAMYGCAEIIKL